MPTDDDDVLDVAAVFPLPHPRGRTAPESTDRLQERIFEHLSMHDGYVAFSGGKDSLAVLDLVRAVKPNVPVVFFDSGLEYPQTYQFVTAVAQRWNLDLHVFAADPPLLDVMIDSERWEHDVAVNPGAEGVDLHYLLMGNPAARAHEKFGPGELWGVRADESCARRLLYTRTARSCDKSGAATTFQDGTIRRWDGTAIFGPLWDWSNEQVWAYTWRRKLPVNPVYDVLAAIGVPEHRRRISHLLDGDHLHRNRLELLRRGWPEIFEQITDSLPRIRHLK